MMVINNIVQKYFQKTTSVAPLAVFRICFGLLMLASIVRFWSKGWIEQLYIQPLYFFPFYGFEFIKPLGEYTYLLFIICGTSALLVVFGWFYRIAIVSLFLSFTYIELLDKSTYLNHYYFVSLVCFLLIFLPAHVYFSVDAYKNRKILAQRIPQWNIDVLKLMLGILYVYAGLAKINSDWLINALPLKIWLPARNDMLIIGFLFNLSWIPFVFSWFGCLYDLCIPFLLLYSRTRLLAYFAVVVFHVLTALLFPIGVFPHVMTVVALIFFSSDFHQKIIDKVSTWAKFPLEFIRPLETKTYLTSNYIKGVFAAFFVIQFFFPFRYLLYSDELFWTEEGYRFSWRVMLLEKAGYVQFTVKDKNGKQMIINNNAFLTKLQEKMMSTQPDMILQYAHILRDYYAKNGFDSPEIYVDSYVALNGRMGKPLISPTTNLAKETESFYHKSWILPLNENIKGF